MILSIIVAATENGVIGKDGRMPWRLPAESAYFKRATLGHPVITGRKNYEAMGRPLPGRLNIVITSQLDYLVPEGVVVVNSLEGALALPTVQAAEEAFIIGGQQLYEAAMPLADKLYLTTVHADIEGDRYFKYEPAEWRPIWSEEHQPDTENVYGFTLQQLVRK